MPDEAENSGLLQPEQSARRLGRVPATSTLQRLHRRVLPRGRKSISDHRLLSGRVQSRPSVSTRVSSLKSITTRSRSGVPMGSTSTTGHSSLPGVKGIGSGLNVERAPPCCPRLRFFLDVDASRFFLGLGIFRARACWIAG